jgi:hypothetical protein
MKFYLKKKLWKFVLFLIAILIGATSLLYTNWLAKNVASKERRSVAVWAEATKQLSSPVRLPAKYEFLLTIIQQNTEIPIIQTDSALRIISASNIRYNEKNKDHVLKRKLNG